MSLAGASGLVFLSLPECANFNQPFDVFFPLFGVPFVLIGLAMLSSPFWASAKVAF
jgi:hypothetical protein